MPQSWASAISYTRDDNGNVTARGSDSFSWDYENRLMLAAAPNAWPLCRVRLRPAAATSATVNSTAYDYTAPPPADGAEIGGRAFAARRARYRGHGPRNSATRSP